MKTNFYASLRKPWLASFVAGAIGFVINSFGLSVLGDAQLIFGGLITLLVVYCFGPWYGGFATAMAFSSTWLSWGHPWGLLCFSAEAVAVGWMMRHRKYPPLQISLLYWIVAGMPLAALTIAGLDDINFPDNWAMVLTLPVNSLLVGLMVLPLYHSRTFRGFAGLPMDRDSQTPLKRVLFRRFGVILAVSVAAFVILAGRAFDLTLRNMIREEIAADGQQVAHQMEIFLDRHMLALSALAAEGTFGRLDPPVLEQKLELLRRSYPGFLTLVGADADGLIVAASPAVGRNGLSLADGSHSVRNRNYFTGPLISRRAYVGNVEPGQLYKGALIVAMSVPVLDQTGRLILVLKASLNVNRLLQAVEPPNLLTDRTVAVVDRTRRVVSYSGDLPKLSQGRLEDEPLFFAARTAAESSSFTYEKKNDGRRERFFSTSQIVRGYGWRVYLAEPVWHVERLIAWYYAVTVLGAAAAIGLALLFASGTATEITAPLTLLVEATRKLARGEAEPDQSPVVPHASLELTEISSELQSATLTLSRSNRKLASAISERDRSHEQLRHVMFHLEDKVRERTAQLQEARRVAESANASKSEFLASMSHELRTPLNVILGMSELLTEQTIGPLNERQIEGLLSINESGRHLLELINDILDLSKIEAGMLDLDFQPTDVTSVCEMSLRFVREAARRKQIKIETNFQNSTPSLVVDERRLKQILVNLLANAVKFTPAGGKVGLDVIESAASATLRFEVWDTGIGIKAEHFDRLFQPFRQIDSSLTRQYSGTGLGLALVKRMTALHGGTVGIESEPGLGSRFSVTLPLGGFHPGIPPSLNDAGQASRENPGRSVPRGTRILIAEDNDANNQVYSEFFRTRGCALSIARNGREAVDLAMSDLPDLVLMDVHMPVMDGYEAMRLLRSNPRTEHLPIIAITALAMPEDRARCIEAGANAYLSKPINLRELGRFVADLAHSSSANQPALLT